MLPKERSEHAQRRRTRSGFVGAMEFTIPRRR